MKTKYFIEPDESGIFIGTDEIARIDSRTVAEEFGESHDSVMKAIENLDSEYFRALNFELSEYRDEDGKIQPCYTMTREGFTYLVQKYIKEEYSQIRKEFFKRFNEMESIVNEKLAEEYRQI